MSLHPPHFPSPAATPENNQVNPQAPRLGPGNDLALSNGDPATRQGMDDALRQPVITQQDLRDQKTREEIEKRLLRLTQDLYELEICAGAVMKDQEDRIPKFLFDINEHYAALNALAQNLRPADGSVEAQNASTGDRIPRKVVEDVDGYRNPHGYTKTTLQRATGENQYALGRILGLESFRRQLESGLKEQMPYVPLPERTHKPVRAVKAERGREGDVAGGEGMRVVENGTTNGDAGALVDAHVREDPSGAVAVKSEGADGGHVELVNGAL